MIKKILLTLFFISSLAYSMGDSINYDDKFNQEVNREIDRNLDNRLNNITLDTFTFKEKNGKNMYIKKVKVGSKVVYINKVTNSNSEARRDVVVKNPIPKGTQYVVGSAICNGGCTISYSTDGGNTLSKQEKRGVKYNYIEFYFKNIPPYKEFRMGFRAIVE
jgi:uncharacterized repeat protein (TIGR01451 family)